MAESLRAAPSRPGFAEPGLIPKKLRLLMELMLESAQAQRWEAVVQINIKFHEVLYAAAGNERIETALPNFI